MILADGLIEPNNSFLSNKLMRPKIGLFQLPKKLRQ